MRVWVLLLLGGLAVLTGTVWTLQGLGHLGGSPMTGVQLWAVLGPIVAVAGLVLLLIAGLSYLRQRRRPSQTEPPPGQAGPA